MSHCPSILPTGIFLNAKARLPSRRAVAFYSLSVTPLIWLRRCSVFAELNDIGRRHVETLASDAGTAPWVGQYELGVVIE
jgi:hypothetical protein